MAKMKIPKRVGGVKIPKKVRRKAKKALKVAESPAVREFAAAALGAAATAKAGKTAMSAGANGRGRGANIVGIDGDRLKDAIRAAAIDGLRRFVQGFEEGLRNAAAGADAPAEGEARATRRPRGGPEADL
jgi:hypothetical protein